MGIQVGRWAVALWMWIASLGALHAADRQYTAYDHQQQRLVQVEEAPLKPHVERRVRNGQHSLVIHHGGGQFILHPGFSSGSIVPEAQEGLLQLYHSALDELCRLVIGDES
jgi:hypothetical protein